MFWWHHPYRRVRYGRPIVVVSGLPRSGTSMLMRMLAAGGVAVWTDGIRTPDDQNPNGYYELERVKELDKGLDKRWLRDGRGRAVKVISSLLEHLPNDNNYQVLFMNRNLEEILDSQRKMLARRGEGAAHAAADARLRSAYEAHLLKTKQLLKHRPQFTALQLTYADLLKAPGGAAHTIADFLGTRLRVDQMAGAIDEALYRNRAGRE